MNNANQQPQKEGAFNAENSTESTPSTPPAVSTPTLINCSFCDKQLLPLDKYKKINSKQRV